MLRTILLVVVVLVLDLLGGQPERAGNARRPVRTEPLPTSLDRRSMLRTILLVVVVLVLDLLGGQPERAGDARRPVRTEPLPTSLERRSMLRTMREACRGSGFQDYFTAK
jgi:hypothetical protein